MMTSRVTKWLLPLAAVLLLLLIVAWMAGSFRNRIEPSLYEPDAIDSGDAVAVERSLVTVNEPVPAGIAARQATTISSRTLARIVRITVRAGDVVKRGQLLIELERSDLESRLAQSEERVRSVSARLTEARSSLERAEQLYGQKLIAAAALDEARANHDALTADLASARQSVREAEVALAFSEIRSPIDGRVVERFAEPGDTASPGEKILTLYNPLSLRVEAAVRESLALPLELNQVLDVEIPSTGQTLSAQIDELVPAADPGSRSFMVKARIDYDGRLLPGMYARLLVPAGRESVLHIPAERVRRFGQLEIVWVSQESVIGRRFIRTGREILPGRLEVLSGLQEGELIVEPPAG